MLTLCRAALMVAVILLPVASAAQSGSGNPAEQKTTATSDQSKTDHPAALQETKGQRVKMQHVTLLTTESDLAVRVKVEDLADFIQSAETQASIELSKNKSAMAALAQFNCRPGKCDVNLASQGQAEEARMQALYVALSKLPPPKVSGEIMFQVRFNVSD